MNSLLRPRAPFEQLQFGGYDLIMIDPPWPTTRRSPKGEGKSFLRHYGAMSYEAIAALPIADLMARDCVVKLWLPGGITVHGGDPLKHFAGADAGRSRPGEVVQAWGLRFSAPGFWVKRTKTGKLGFGTGYRVRDAGEPWWICIKGAPRTSRSCRNVYDGLLREHSRKPEEAFAWCERFMPGARKLELFSRCSRPGWDSWGFEAGKFDPVVQLAAAA